MSTGRLADGVRALGLLTRPPDPRPDAELVAGFVAGREEAAFAELVRRHGPTVYGVCRRVLGNGHDADDAFQAVWLVLARKAGSVRPPGAVGAFLYGVAVRVATKARAQAAKRRQRLMAAAKPERTADVPDWSDLRPVLDDELAALPEKYRVAVVLCDLTGKSRSEAAAALGWPEGTVAARVAKGRALLADRLRRRGITLSVAALGGLLTPEATACPVPAAVQSLALDVLATDAVIPQAVQLLAEGVVRPMKTGTLVMLAAGLLTAAGLTAGAMLGGNGDEKDWERPPGEPVATADGQPAFGPWELQAVLKDHGQMVYGATFAPDGRTFSTIGADSTLIVWDAATRAKKHSYPVTWDDRGTLVQPAPPPGAVQGVKLPPWRWLQYLPDGTLFVTGLAGAGIDYHLFDPASGARLDEGELPGGGRTTGVRLPGVLAMSADGTRMLLSSGGDLRIVPRTAEGKSKVVEKSAEPGLVGTPWLPTARAFNRDGTRLALVEQIINRDKNEVRYVVRVGDGDTGKTVASLACAGMPYAVAWSPDGKWLAAACGQEARLWTTSDWEAAPVVWKPPYVYAFSVAFTPDSRQLLLGYWQSERGFWQSKLVNRVGAWSLPGMKQEQHLDVNPDEGVIAMAVSSDGRTLVAAVGNHRHAPNVGKHADPEFRRKNGEVRVFTRKPVTKPAPPKAEEKPKADDGPERNQDLWVWQPRIVPEAEGGKVPRSVAFAPDGKFLVTGGAKRSVQFWTLSTNPLRSNEHSLSPSPADDAPSAAAVSPDGKTVAFTRPNGVTVAEPDPWCWRLGPPRGKPIPPDWEKLNPPPPPADPFANKVFETFQTPAPLTALAFSPDGQRVAFTDGRKLTVRDIGRAGEVSFGPMNGTPKGDLPAAVAWAPDGKRVLFLTNNKIDPDWAKAGTGRADPAKATHHFAQIWGAGSGEAMAMLVHGTIPVTAVAWSANGKRIATADDKGEVAIWDGETFTEVKRLKAGGPVTALAFRADGQRLAVGVRPPAKIGVQVFTAFEGSSPDNWLSSSTLGVGEGAVVRSVAFSPDGKVLAAGADDGLHVWDRVKVAPK